MRGLGLILNVVAAILLPLLILDSGGPSDHGQAIYRGWRINRLQVNNQSSGIDLRVDAGQTVVPAVETAGRWASWWVGKRTNQPAFRSYQAGVGLLVIFVPMLIAVSSLLTKIAAYGFPVLISSCLWYLRSNIDLIDAGHVELVLLGPVFCIYLAGLKRMHTDPGIGAWLALVASSFLGWQLFPILWLMFFIPASVAWLIIAFEHSWTWHAAISLAAVTGAAPSIHHWHDLVGLGGLIREAIPFEAQRIWIVCGESTTQLSVFVAIHVFITLTAFNNARLIRQSATVLIAAVTTLVGICYANPSSWTWTDFHLKQVLSRPMAPSPIMPWVSAFTGKMNRSRVLVEAASTDQTEAASAYDLLLNSDLPVIVGVRGEGSAVPWQFHNGRLAGRTLSDWTDDELMRFFERWNIGWILVQSADTANRLSQRTIVKQIELAAQSPYAFSVKRPHRFVLKGQGHCSFREDGSLVLTDCQPEAGEMVLSMKYDTSLRVSPARARVSPEIDPYDPWPVVRLQFDEPMHRLMLRGGGR